MSLSGDLNDRPLDFLGLVGAFRVVREIAVLRNGVLALLSVIHELGSNFITTTTNISHDISHDGSPGVFASDATTTNGTRSRR